MKTNAAPAEELKYLRRRVGEQGRTLAERDRQEASYRQELSHLIDALESISEGFILYDADERLIHCNSQYRELFPEIADLVVPGIRLEDFLRAAAERGQIAEAVGNNEEWTRKRLHQYRTAEGVIEQQLNDGRWVLGSVHRTQNGNIVGIRTDITERKRAQQALLASEHTLQERIADLEAAHGKLETQAATLIRLADDLLVARDEARTANRAKSEFLAAMSHELRTPLNAILGFSEVITNETFGPVGTPKYREYAKNIFESGQHLLGLINDILDLSKIESGTDELREDIIDVPEIIRSALKLTGHRAEDGGIKLELELQDQLPALRADERKLKQILVNLLSNAIKFTDAGGGVTVRAWCRMDSGCVFQIVDTGIGIAPEDIPTALSRFGQVDGDLNRRYEGTGLGLPLTKALVEMHGGILDLQSKVGVGTTVTVRFPAMRIVASLGN